MYSGRSHIKSFLTYFLWDGMVVVETYFDIAFDINWIKNRLLLHSALCTAKLSAV